MKKIRPIFTFIFSNFGPLIGFYLINQFWGLKAGIIVSFILAGGEYTWLKFKKKKISSLFYFSTGMLFIFGTADLYVEEPLFIKYEAPINNLLVAVFFGLSLFKEKSILQEIAESMKKTSVESSVDKVFFFKLMTIVWCLYFIVKAIFYLWLNLHTDFNEAVLLRVIVGKISFWIMLGVSIGLARPIWKILVMLRVFPSQKCVEVK